MTISKTEYSNGYRITVAELLGPDGRIPGWFTFAVCIDGQIRHTGGAELLDDALELAIEWTQQNPQSQSTLPTGLERTGDDE